MRGYDFADEIIVSDGGSTDDSVSLLKVCSRVTILHFPEQETVNGETWNPDNTHINFLLDVAKATNPDFIIFDDMDCVPNASLREHAREILESSIHPQVNVFRLYLWGDTKYYPKMNNTFDENFTSLWAWRPSEINIRADETIRHGTLVGLSDTPTKLLHPYCLLHKSWHPNTIDAKIARYNKLGLPMQHPKEFAGELEDLPEYAHE